MTGAMLTKRLPGYPNQGSTVPGDGKYSNVGEYAAHLGIDVAAND